MGLWRLPGGACGSFSAGNWTQGPGCTALDQGRAYAVSTLGMGEAGIGTDSGPVLCQFGRTGPDLENIFKAFVLVGIPDAAGD